MKVCVIGTGYVGLVTGVCLAFLGHEVVCVDTDATKIEKLRRGESPIYEPGLNEILEKTIKADSIRFSTSIQTGVSHGEIIFIAVGTPSLPDGRSNMAYVEVVARAIGTCLTSGTKPRVIVNKSTVPVGTGEWVKALILEESPEASFEVVSNPEFLREGSAISDTFAPDRIVLGSNSDWAKRRMIKLYEPLHSCPPFPIVLTDLASAEMIKYASNAFLATKISFANELANICERVGADIGEVTNGMGLDTRIGPKFLQAGIGWGGSCFGKDVSSLISLAEDYGYNAPILKAAVEVNKSQIDLVVRKLQSSLKVLKGKTIGLLGLTFKPDTDDLRDAPSIALIAKLVALGARVKVFDPLISATTDDELIAKFGLVPSVKAVARGSNALVLVTEWAEFVQVDWAEIQPLMAESPVFLDARNFVSQDELEGVGFEYIGVGK